MWTFWFNIWFPQPESETHEVIGIDFIERRVIWRTVS